MPRNHVQLTNDHTRSRIQYNARNETPTGNRVRETQCFDEDRLLICSHRVRVLILSVSFTQVFSHSRSSRSFMLPLRKAIDREST